ncbi:MAG: hypothetical protein ABJE10_20400 [bacterium]
MAFIVDKIQLHIVPVLPRGGVRLFEHLGSSSIQLDLTAVVDAPGVTHIRYRVVR